MVTSEVSGILRSHHTNGFSLRLVEIGAAAAGALYASDALASDRVRVVAQIPGDLHAPVRYAASARTEHGDAFISMLRSTYGAQAFERAGLQSLQATTAPALP